MDEYNMESNIEFLDDETTCSVCYAEFLDTNDLSQHITQMHLNETTVNRYCFVCRSFYQDVEAYASHIRTYHIKSLRWCKYCTRVFFNKEDLRKHEKKHGDWKYKSCLHCDKTFLYKDILAAHEYKNHRTYTDTCEGIMLQDCFPALSSVLHMNVKKFLTVPYTHELYKCISCGLTTSNIDKFLQHIETEIKKPFVCNECCQVFNCKYKLCNHTKSKCNKSMEWSECGMCEKKIESAALETHVKQCHRRKYVSNDHDTPKTIPILNCKFCKKMFVGNIALDKHIDRSHKPNFHLYKYKCTLCDIPYQHPKYLFAHYFTHHKDMQPYTCKICDKKYKVRKSFTLHIKLDHKSVGFVEFDKDYKVFFTDKKSEKPFQPYCVLPEYLLEKQKNSAIETENCKNLTVEKSDFIMATETECETDVDRIEIHMLKVENADDVTECNTDVEAREKSLSNLAENGENETEFETDADTGGKVISKPATDASSNMDKRDKAKLRRSVKGVCESEMDKPGKKDKSKKKSKVLKTKDKNKQNYSTDMSSNDSDVPLIDMTKRNMDILIKKKKKNKFFCLKCNKNCYTYQNYNHHMSLHVRCKLKKCIKCQKTFKSKIALDEHMKKKHTTSKLTETLKQVLERRKNGVQVTTDPLTLRENFKKTIYKVNIPEDDSTPAVIKLVEDGLSAKSFIESFIPEDSSKEIRITSSITIKETKGGYRSPLIKMIKFKPDSPTKSNKLRMPVKFKPEIISHTKAKLKVIQKPPTTHKPQLALTTAQEESIDNILCQSYNEDDVFVDDREEIPEVAEEVMLNTEDKEDIKEIKMRETQNSIVIPNIPDHYGDIKIAHLQQEAPFYKIVSMKDIVKTHTRKSQQLPTAAPAPTSGPVTLPGGMKLVTVNPLAHLLGNTNVEKLIKPNKHYVPKVGDIKSAIEKALKNVHQPKRRRKVS